MSGPRVLPFTGAARVNVLRGSVLSGLAVAFGYNVGEEDVSVRVIGPCEIDYTDLPDPGDHVDLFTLALGDVILSFFPDPDTFVVFETSGGPVQNAVRLGQGAAWELDQTGGMLGYPDAGDQEGPPADSAANIEVGDRYAKSGEDVRTALHVITETNAVRAYNANVEMTAGHVDVYFLVATPVAP